MPSTETSPYHKNIQLHAVVRAGLGAVGESDRTPEAHLFMREDATEPDFDLAHFIVCHARFLSQ